PSRHAAVGAYIFFAVQMLVAAFHMPPAFAHSAAVLAFVTSPAANAGPVKASATATATTETRVFMSFLLTSPELETPSWQPLFLTERLQSGSCERAVLNNPAKRSRLAIRSTPGSRSELVCSSRYSCGFYPRLALGLHIDGTKRGRGLGDDDQVASHFDVEVNLNVEIFHRRESGCFKRGSPIEATCGVLMTVTTVIIASR